jgi:outer membrane protein TolC
MKLLKLIALLFPLVSAGQEIFTFDSFINNFELNHPVFKISKASIGQSEADLLKAKGAFDPSVSVLRNNKTLDGKNYYKEQNPELKWQSPYGFSLKAGNDYNAGQYLNNELTPGNLSYMGIELPVLKGLLIDQNRATRKTAELMISQNTEEQRNSQNDVYLEASEQYWQWAFSYQTYLLFKNQKENAFKRQEMTKLGFENGAKSVADTVEAFLQIQNIDLLEQEAFIDLRSNAIALSAFLWDENGEPFLINTSLVPEELPKVVLKPDLEELIYESNLSHPKLVSFAFKLDGLGVERLLNKQSLLPTLNLKYNVLGKDYFSAESIANPYLRNNYKFGFDFKVPLFLRESRGKFEKTKLKIQETSLQKKQTEWVIENKIRGYALNLNLLEKQLYTANELSGNYAFMLKNEELKFTEGYSSLFLIISRENKLLEARQKALKINLNYIKAYYKQQWAAGLLAPQSI